MYLNLKLLNKAQIFYIDLMLPILFCFLFVDLFFKSKQYFIELLKICTTNNNLFVIRVKIVQYSCLKNLLNIYIHL